MGKPADYEAGRVFESLPKAEQERRGIWPDKFRCDCCLGEYSWDHLYANQISQQTNQPNKLPWCYECCNLKKSERKKMRLDSRQQDLTKVCNKCRVERSAFFFGLDNRNKDGRQGRCQACVQEQRYLDLNKPDHAQKNRERVKAWKKANPDKIKESRRKRARAVKAQVAYSNWRDQYCTPSPT